jgi:hypothetical protein
MLTAPKDDDEIRTYYSGAEFRRRTGGPSDRTVKLWRRKGMPYHGGGLIRPKYTDESLEWVKRGGAQLPGREAPAN